MEQEHTDILVLGSGAAGTAIAYTLAQLRRFSVALVYRGEEEGSSFSNQKWKHSGALYPVRELARTAWDAYSAMDRYGEGRYIRGPKEAQFFSDDPVVLRQLEAQWNAWGVRDWGLLIEPIHLPPSASIGSFGQSCFRGGFRTPDCVLDFGEMIRDFRSTMASSGVVVRRGVTVREIVREGDGVTGVLLEDGTRQELLRCRHCIVAMGAWSLSLLEGIDVRPPVRITKSNVLAVDGELVDRITIWIRHEVTIVPYRGRTLIADARFVPIADADDLSPYGPHVDELLGDLSRCFPNWHPTYRSVHGCIKTAEVLSHGLPNPNIAIYCESEGQGYCHGVSGLTVVFPGKASFMWTVAARVAASVERGLGGLS